MTIASKIIPAFYVIDIEGNAATLEKLIGTSHKIKTISISSIDIANDLEAYDAMDKTIQIFGAGALEDQISVNPEFFPSVPAIPVTQEMEDMEEQMRMAAQQLEETDINAIATSITRRFDEWGDFVAIKRKIYGENFSINGKVAIHPHQYLKEKNNERREQQEKLYTLPIFNVSTPIH